MWSLFMEPHSDISMLSRVLSRHLTFYETVAYFIISLIGVVAKKLNCPSNIKTATGSIALVNPVTCCTALTNHLPANLLQGTLGRDTDSA